MTEENMQNLPQDPQPSEGSENNITQLQKERDEYLNNWKRAAADLINYKKEEMERMAFLGKYAKEDMVFKVLPILDNIILAEKQLPENLKNGKEGSAQAIEWTKGFLQIQHQITDFLKKEGIEAIEVLGKPFDPATMEIVSEATGGEELAPGIVIEELQRGYKMGEKVLRPAKVKVSK